MEVSLLSNIEYFDSDFQESIFIDDNFAITPRDKIIIPDDWEHTIGKVQYHSLYNSKYFIWFDIIDDITDEISLLAYCKGINIFFFSLWLYKHQKAYCRYFIINKVQDDFSEIASTTFLGSFHSNPSFEGIFYSKDDILNASSVYQQILDHLILDNTRIQMFVFFLYLANVSDNINVAFTNRIIFLEALLGTDSPTELSHQIAERVIAINHKNKDVDEKYSIYRKIKESYNFRSKVVHGVKLSKKDHNKIIEIDKFIIDECCNLYINILKNKQLEDLFKLPENDFNKEMIKMLL